MMVRICGKIWRPFLDLTGCGDDGPEDIASSKEANGLCNRGVNMCVSSVDIVSP